MERKNENSKWSGELSKVNSFPEIEMLFSKSKADVWKEMEMKTSVNERGTKTIKLQWLKYAIAAGIVLLLGSTAFMNMYTKTIHTPKGKHMSVLLPDDSQVELNANSTLSYKPYWWMFSRKVQFEGEGFFNVTKGSQFEIASERGRTYILGTSFNIYARGEEYKVSCYTGKVKVVSAVTSEELLLLPNDHAYVTPNGRVELKKRTNQNEKATWINKVFFFTDSPLEAVLKEIELQYDINIVEKGKFDLFYTGNFQKEESVDSILYKVCKPFGLNYVNVSGKNYIITSKATR